MINHTQSATFAITTSEIQLLNKAQALAERLQLPLLTDEQSSCQFDFILTISSQHLSLSAQAYPNQQPFYIDFTGGKLRYRQTNASRKQEAVVKAMGKPSALTVIDATAGLGRDSFILATCGFQVVMVERSPIVHALLADGLERAALDPALRPIIDRLTLVNADSVDYLNGIGEKPAIIYLDPMFPTRKKAAAVKKEMALLQQLDLSSQPEELFNVSLTCAAQRVVVKRPRLATYLADKTPNYSLSGTSSRFDIYLV